MSSSSEEKRKRIEKHGFKIRRVVSSAHPEGLYVACREGNKVWFSATSIYALHKQIFGY